MPTTTLHVAMRFRRKRVVVWAILLAIFAAGTFWLHRSFNPPWRVRVAITNIPVGTTFASLVTDSGGTLRNIEWSPKSEVLVPFAMHPADCGWSFQNPDNPKVDWDAYVRWQPGEHYGVVTKGMDGTWRVTWFQADSVPIRAQRWLLGNGEASFDIAVGRTADLPAEDVRSLGLDATP